MRRLTDYAVAHQVFLLFMLSKYLWTQLQLRPVLFDSWGGVSCCERKLLFLAMALCPIWPWVTQNCNTFCLHLKLKHFLNTVDWTFHRSVEEPSHDWKLCPSREMFIHQCVDLGKHCISLPRLKQVLDSDENLHARHMSISWSPCRTASVSLGPEFFDPWFSPVAMWWQKGDARIGLDTETL